MNFFISIISFLVCIQMGSSFKISNTRKITFNNRLDMSLQGGGSPDNENEPKPIINNKDIVKSISFPLAKEYHKFLLKYKIRSNEEINEIMRSNLNTDSTVPFELKFNEESSSVKIAKSRMQNYLIFEKNWNKINDINKKGSNLINFKVSINKYADSIDFNENFRSDKIPDDLMKKQIKKNVKYSWKIFSNTWLNKFNDYTSTPVCMLEIIKGMFNIKSELKEPLEENIDWASKGMTTMVKDQGQCGSCWAFSAVSTLESYMRINNKSYEMLSEQELVDCSTEDYGCNGGFMDTAYDYVIENNGLHSSVDYPYTAKDGKCKAECCQEYNDYIEENKNIELESFDKSIKKFYKEEFKDEDKDMRLHRRVPGSRFSKYRFFEPESVEDIKKSLKNGPIAIALDANSFFFRFYESGVIDLPSEYSYGLNHAVMLVGWDKDSEGEHWIIQNSWGSGWGDKGFVRLRIREGEGTLLCQIYGVYPYK